MDRLSMKKLSRSWRRTVLQNPGRLDPEGSERNPSFPLPQMSEVFKEQIDRLIADQEINRWKTSPFAK